MVKYIIINKLNSNMVVIINMMEILTVKQLEYYIHIMVLIIFSKC